MNNVTAFLLSLLLICNGSLQLQASLQASPKNKRSLEDAQKIWDRIYKAKSRSNIKHVQRVSIDEKINTEHIIEDASQISEDEQQEQDRLNDHRSKKMRSESNHPEDIKAYDVDTLALDTINFYEAQAKNNLKKQKLKIKRTKKPLQKINF